MPIKKQIEVSLGKLRRLIARYFPQIRIGLVVFGLILLILIFRLLLPSFINLGKTAIGIASGGVSLISQSANDLKGENGRVNLLLLGIGGGERAGTDLTDTIIFVSADPKFGNTLMLSLPRDIWLSSMRAKLNTAYHYGNQKKPKGGLVLAKAAVSEILDQPVNYGLVVNFTGFEKMIDIFGGVKVNVEKGFDDFYYPIPGKENDDCGGDLEFRCRYEHLHFDAGEQVMNGERALKYARSRYAEGEEGSDFARSRRQQQLMATIKRELFSFKTLVNPFKLVQLIKVANQNFETDISQKDFGGMVKLLFKMRQGKLTAEVLDGGVEGKEGYLINPPSNLEKYDGHWVLIPRTGSWEEIQEHLRQLLKQN